MISNAMDDSEDLIPEEGLEPNITDKEHERMHNKKDHSKQDDEEIR